MLLSISVTPFGIFISSNKRQCSKAPAPIVSTVSGILILFNLSQLEKPNVPIALTGFPFIFSGIVTSVTS